MGYDRFFKSLLNPSWDGDESSYEKTHTLTAVPEGRLRASPSRGFFHSQKIKPCYLNNSQTITFREGGELESS